MLVLGIESSCDESAAALLEFNDQGHTTVHAEAISSQNDLHAAYGGVVPELAAREHLRFLPLVVNKVLGASKPDLVAVTRGPGLKGCLLMGTHFAQGWAMARNLPLVGVNHIEGHLLAPLLDNPTLAPPYLALIVSGGHTEILRVDGLGRYTLVSRTIDDAAGEAFDKAANLLGFTYPGGATLAACADEFLSAGGQVDRELKLPKVMLHEPGFSFSGLKTAISLLIKKVSAEAKELPHGQKQQLAAVIQSAIIEVLLRKIEEARRNGCEKWPIAVSGGVSANKALRSALQARFSHSVYFPQARHCTDNAAMIAFAGGVRYLKDKTAHSDLAALSSWPVEEVRW
jgi:N6-L-threonylcarbamoyladenine synthase